VDEFKKKFGKNPSVRASRTSPRDRIKALESVVAEASPDP